MFPHVNMGLFRHRSPRSPHGLKLYPRAAEVSPWTSGAIRTRHCGEGLFAAGDVDQSGAGEPQDPAATYTDSMATQWRLWCTHWHHDINGCTIFWLLVWFTKYPAFENLWSLGSVLRFVLTWVFLLLVHQQCNAAVTGTASGLLPHPLLGRFGRHLRHKAATRHTWHAWHLWHIWHIWLHMSVFVYGFVLHTYVKYTCILYLCNLHVKYT